MSRSHKNNTFFTLHLLESLCRAQITSSVCVSHVTGNDDAMMHNSIDHDAANLKAHSEALRGSKKKQL